MYLYVSCHIYKHNVLHEPSFQRENHGTVKILSKTTTWRLQPLPVEFVKMPQQIITITMDPTQCATVVEHFLWDLSKGTKYRKHWKTLAGVIHYVKKFIRKSHKNTTEPFSILVFCCLQDKMWIEKCQNELFFLISSKEFVLITDIFWQTFWCNKWQSIFWGCKRLQLKFF